MAKESPTYQIQFKGTTVIEPSTLWLKFKDGQFKRNLQMQKPRVKKVNDTYELVVGETKSVRDHHNEVTIPLIDPASGWEINLVIRVFNDGVAFCYTFPKQKNRTDYTLLDEKSSFRIAGNPTIRTLF